MCNSHNDPAVEKPELSLVPVVADWFLTQIWPTLLRLSDAVADPGYPVRDAHLALPLVLGHGLQRRSDALQVVDGRARLAAQQVAESVTRPAVVVVLHGPFAHQLLAGHVGGQKAVDQKLQHLHLALQRAVRVILDLQVLERAAAEVGLALAVSAHHLGPGHAVHQVQGGVDAVLEVGGPEGGVGRVFLAQDGLQQGDVRLCQKGALLLARQRRAEVLEAERRETQNGGEGAQDFVYGRGVQQLLGGDQKVLRRLWQLNGGNLFLFQDRRARSSGRTSPPT